MDFSLHQMVKQTLAAAAEREKWAQAEGEETSEKKKEEEKGKPPAKTPPDNTATAPERNEETMTSTEGEKTSSAFVEKLASACEHLNRHFWKVAQAPESSPMGPDKGPSPTPTNADSPTPGTQSERTGQATDQQQPPMKPGADVKSEGQTNPDTALETDMNSPPGGSEDWTDQDKLKQAARGFMGRQARALRGLGRGAVSLVTGKGGKEGKKISRKVVLQRMGERAREAAPSLAAGGGTVGAGGYGLSRLGKKKKEEGKKKKAEVDLARVRYIMAKMAADAENPASVGAKVTDPHQSLPEGAAQSEEGVPSQPGETSKQESLVGSIERAISYTKQDAKAVPKARMGEVLDEPAQRKATDPVLHENLDATSGAGVKLSSAEKIAAARALLRKIAQEGAAPDASPEKKEMAAKLEAAVKAKQNGEGDQGEKKTNGEEGKEGEEKTSGGLPLQGGY